MAGWAIIVKLIIPKDFAKQYGLDEPSHVVVEGKPNGIFIRKLTLLDGEKQGIIVIFFGITPTKGSRHSLRVMPAKHCEQVMVIVNTESSNLNYSIAADHTYCDLCALNGYPNQKVVFEYEGLRPEEQDGFIYKFSVYEYPC